MQGTIAYDISPVRGPLANAFVILINALFFNVKLVGLYDVYPRDYSDRLLNEDDLVFDFIIVGAGAAGCALANRLTENEAWNVLLVEAGDYPPPSTEVPGLYFTFIRSEEDWQFMLEKDPKACQAMADSRCMVSRGKVLGGTSSIDSMRHMRGTVYNYDKLGQPLFSANITYSIFQELENYEKQDHEDLHYTYGAGGLLHLDHTEYNIKIKPILQDAYRATGYTRIPRRKFLGFTDHLLYTRNGERFNMAKTFLTPIKERPNLFLSKKTEVEGIVLKEPSDRRVNGVNVSISGIKFFIRARKEVILTAGAINNAKLLLLSGIGPRDYLQSRNIPVVVDLPSVGKNLQFHLNVPLYVSVEPCCDIPKDYYRDFELIGDVFEYLMYRTGNLSHTGISNFITYISTLKSGATLPNIAIYHKYFKIGDRNLMAWLEGRDYHSSIRKTLLTVNAEKMIVLFMVNLLEPRSRGELYLNDTHYLSNPKVKPNFMSDDENYDYDILLSGFNYVTNITNSPEMKKHKMTFIDLDVPNCRNFKFCSMAYVKCYMASMAFPSSEVVGSTTMGEKCDQSSVVMKDLEVKQVRCLRVGDSSVLKEIPIGNTLVTDAAIGLNLGEILRMKWMKDYASRYHKPVDEPPDEVVET